MSQDLQQRGAGSAWRDFDRVAPCYEQRNLMLEIEAELGQSFIPSLEGKRILDVGCGTGRWDRWAFRNGAACVLQLDRSLAMLQEARRVAVFESGGWPLQADFCRIPVAPSSIDCVLASLCLSYTQELEEAVSQIALSLRPGGSLYLSDVHPDSVGLGWKRTYTLPGGGTIEPPYCIHSLAEYRRCLAACGLNISRWKECFIDNGIEELFKRAGHWDRYRRWHGAPLLLLALADKPVAR